MKHINLVIDNRKFGKTVQSAQKCQSNNKIVLLQDDETISDDTEVAEIFNRFFATVTEPLGIKENNDNIPGTEGKFFLPRLLSASRLEKVMNCANSIRY